MSEETQEKLTPEQIEANRIRVINYYKNQIEVLTIQCEYEKLLAEMESHRAKRMEMIIRQAQMSAGPGEEQENEQELSNEQHASQDEVAEEKKERKLKSK
jgi:hypothetical protein